MPITDYGHYVAAAVVLGVRGRLRAYWSRLFNRGEDSVEGYEFKGYK